MRTVFKLHSSLDGNNVNTSVLTGKEGGELHPVGLLIQSVENYALFKALLCLGAEYNDTTKRDVRVVCTGADEIVAELYKQYREGLDSDPTPEVPVGKLAKLYRRYLLRGRTVP